MTNIENAQVVESKSTTTKPQAEKKAPRVLQATQPKVANATLRTPIPNGESAKREFKPIDATKLQATYSFKLSDKDADRYQVESVFDFSNCSAQEIMELAASSVRITIQGKLRAMGQGALNTSAFANVDVKKECIDSARSSADDFTKASRALGKLSDAEKQRLLAALSAK